jgi:hypothetical protein
MGQLIMDEHQQLLEQRTPLLSAGVPTSGDDALHSLQHSRQGGQVRQRRDHEDQTPLSSYDFGTQHARRVEAQRSLAVLTKRFLLPPLQVQTDDLDGIPVRSLRRLNKKAMCQLRLGETPYKAYLDGAQGADPQQQAPVGVQSDRARTTRMRKDQRNQLSNSTEKITS